MFSILVGLLIGAFLFLIRILLRLVTSLLSVAFSKVTKKLKVAYEKSKLKTGIDIASDVSGKTKDLSVLSLKLLLKTIEVTLKALKFAIRVLDVIVSALISMFTFVGIPLVALIMVIVLAVATVVTTMDDLDGGKKQSGYSSQIGLGSYNYMDIDWSQDFTEKLDVIESSYGKNERDVVEYVIICMNTQQNFEETNVPVQGYCIGNIVVESGGSSNLMGGATGHPSNDYTLRNAEEGVTWQYASGDSSGKGYPKADGLFQIITSGWVGYNELYSEQSSKLTPQLNRDTDWHQLRYYCPSVAYGTLTKYKSIVDGDSYEFENSDGLSAVSHAFQLMGIEETEGRRKFVKNACMASYAYGSLTERCYADRTDAKHDLATNIALFVLSYCENYLEYDTTADTYLYTELSTELSQSVIENRCGADIVLSFSNAVCQAVYGTTRKGTFSEDMLAEGSFGTLDIEGNSIDGTIDAYLYSTFSEDAKSFFELTKGDTIDYMSSAGYNARCYYDVSMLLTDNYMLETSANLLGLKSAEVSSDWMKAYQEMGMWYANNINTYCSNPDNSKGTAGGRTWYSCPLLGGSTVGDDCSSFVTACLAYADIHKGYVGGSAPRSGEFTPDNDNVIVSELMSAGFKWVPYSSSYVPTAGDIIIMTGHIEIIAGYSGDKVYVFSWGNNYSFASGRGLPHSWSSREAYLGYWNKGSKSIVGVWRK